ncbi:MAG: GNAT family N-acetyltransferase [Roseovarius sp.]|nr:GNAT family N-acetyltransferase [Roseovarius sp.]
MTSLSPASASPAGVPVIETAELVLRGYREADFEAFAAFSASPRACFVGGPQTRWEAWRSFMAAIGHWGLRGYGMWIVECRDTGQVAGRVGVMMNDGWLEPELAWHLYDGFEGRGLAWQAARAARAHAARHWGMPALISYIDPANTRSRRLAERLGARPERDVEVLSRPCQLWRHPAAGGL